MMASSTSTPTAIASPPSVIVLTAMPKAAIAMIATASESGIATTEIAVVCHRPRNASRTITTSTAPSRKANVTFRTATLMKSACRNRSVSMVMPGGRVRFRSVKAASIRPVSSKVLAPGCFCTAITTPGSALIDPVPIFGAAPIRTVATCPISTGDPPRTATADRSTPR